MKGEEGVNRIKQVSKPTAKNTSLHFTSPRRTSSALIGAEIRDESVGPVGGGSGGDV